VPWIKIDTIVDVSLAVARRHFAPSHTSDLITGASHSDLKFELYKNAPTSITDYTCW